MFSAILTIAQALVALPKLVDQIKDMIAAFSAMRARQDAALIDAFASEVAKIKPGSTKEEIDETIKKQFEALEKLRGPVGRIGS